MTTRYEYKAVPAPEKGLRRRGLRGAARLAAAFEEVLAAEAVDGWEYLRTDLVPVLEKPGPLSRPRQVTRAVMVFRRLLPAAPVPEEAAGGAGRAEPALFTAPRLAPGAGPGSRPEPTLTLRRGESED